MISFDRSIRLGDHFCYGQRVKPTVAGNQRMIERIEDIAFVDTSVRGVVPEAS